MTDEEASNLFGFDDANLGFIDDASASASASGDLKSDRSGLADENQFTSSGWDYTDTNPFASFDVVTTAPSIQPTYQTTSWEPSFFDATQQSPGFDALSSPPENNPSFMFGGPLLPLQEKARPRNPVVQTPRNPVNTLTPALQEKLRNIAMPPHLQYHSPKSASSPESPAGGAKNTDSHSSPDHDHLSSKPQAKKRKMSEDDDEDEDEDDDGKPVKKTSHNMIEKRYRNNLNDKIAALRDAVPSLRIMSKSARGEDTTEDRQELHGLTPAHKLNKATVLSKATEYIRHMEKRYTRLQEQNSTMRARIAAFEKLFMAGAMNGSIAPMQQTPSPLQYAAKDSQQQDFSPVATSHDPSTTPPTGMIPVPDDMKRILAAQMAAQPYPVPSQQYQRATQQTLIQQQQIQQQQQQMQQGRWGNAGPYFGKLMVGSLAGLMLLEAVREEETSNETPQGRGLFVLPIQIIGKLTTSLDFNCMGYHVHTSLKLILLLGTVMWIFVPSLFSAPDQKPKEGVQISSLQPAPSLASPITVRRQAWLTAVQSVWIPRHNFFFEAAALMLKAAKLSLRNVIGIQGYQLLSGISKEQEIARVKAWSIALDAQLAGGDIEINNSRLILTLLASGTLPDTPIRLMLKSLHIRVLLWDLSNHRWNFSVTSAVAAKLAGSQWKEARQLNRVLALARHEDELPEHLSRLVEQDCDDVFNADIIQRAHNLAFNMDTNHGVQVPIDGMDFVVDDNAVGSPMDAVAAWWSTQTLHQALTATLSKNDIGLASRADDLDLAIKTAPVGSVAQARAVIARAVLSDHHRGSNIAIAVQTVGTDKAESTLNKSISIIDSGSYVSSPDLRLALRCATAIAHLRRVQKTPGADLQGLHIIQTILIHQNPSTISLLGFTAALELTEQLFEHKPATETFSSTLERLAGGLRLWIGGPSGDHCGVGPDVRHKVVDRCLGITKSLVGMEVDTGYGSLDEDEC